MSKNIYGHECDIRTINVPVCIRKNLIAELNPENDKLAVVIGLNPSKANNEQSDNTVTRLENYFEKEGYGKLIIYNIFQNYSTNPIGICAETATDFSENSIQEQLKKADKIVLAYGLDEVYKSYIENCLNNIMEYKDKFYCFCKKEEDKNPTPIHPRALGYNWLLKKYDIKGFLDGGKD